MLAAAADFLPLVVAVAAGYVLARWGALPPRALRRLLRYALFPVLIFAVLVDRADPMTFAILVGVGGAMALVGMALVYAAPHVLRPPVDPSAAIPNVACFALPFLAMSWSSVGLGVACAVFVGVSVVQLAVERRIAELAREPWLYAVGAALLVKMLLGIPDADGLLARTAAPLAAAGYPVLLIFLGASLHPFEGIGSGTAWASAAVRLVAGFGVGLLAVALLPMSRGVMEALIVVSLAPPASKSLTLTDRLSDRAGGRAAVAAGTPLALVAMVLLWVIRW